MRDSRTAHRLAQALDRFLFAPAHLPTIRLFRVALALMLAWNFWPYRLELARELRDKPLLPELYDQFIFTAPYHILIGVLLFLFAIGWRVRIIGILLLLLLLPLDFLVGAQQSRQIMLFTLLAFLFLPGDALWASGGENPPAPPLWPIRLIQIQLSLVYGINALVKTTPHFLTGEALIGMSQHLPNFRVDLASGYLHLPMLALPVWMLAVATVIAEYSLAVGFWFVRLRISTAVLGVMFHLMLKLFIKIHMLDWVSLFLYLAFLLPFSDKTNRSSEVREASS